MDDAERLIAVQKYLDMNIAQIADKIGMMRADTLYRVRRGEAKLSRKFAERIEKKFPEISAGWLLTGEGEMLNSTNKMVAGALEQLSKMRDLSMAAKVEALKAEVEFWKHKFEECLGMDDKLTKT